MEFEKLELWEHCCWFTNKIFIASWIFWPFHVFHSFFGTLVYYCSFLQLSKQHAPPNEGRHSRQRRMFPFFHKKMFHFCNFFRPPFLFKKMKQVKIMNAERRFFSNRSGGKTQVCVDTQINFIFLGARWQKQSRHEKRRCDFHV